jgi:putative peptidoglycan lipid II flippase
MGNQVAGGVVAYQFAFVAFLAPYAILAQPVHTTILPDLSLDAERGDTADFAERLRWALDGMAMLLLPVSAAYLALAEPVMRAITFGAAKGGVDLLAAALASLGVGLFTYACFLSIARAFYAIGDSRTPAIVAAGAAAAGAAIMIAGSLSFHTPAAKVASLGAGHSAAYFLGALTLGGLLRRRIGHPFFPHAFWRAFALSAVLGVAAWAVERAISPSGRIATLAVVAAIVAVGAAVYLSALRFLPRALWRREREFEPVDPDLAVEP